MIRRPPRSTLFPTRRSSDLDHRVLWAESYDRAAGDIFAVQEEIAKIDRKSTRLNSSHSQISYAVFCLKKKKKTTPRCALARPRIAPPQRSRTSAYRSSTTSS